MRIHRVRNLGIGLVVLAAGLGAGPVYGAAINSAGSGFWTNTATWSGGVVPGIADAVTILNGHTITNSDAIVHDVGSLTVNSGGVLTHASNTTDAAGEKYKIILNVASNLTIAAGGQINVDGRGYSNCQGPGKPAGGGTRAGGSYGGKGGIDIQLSSGSGPTYGSITAPTNIGSASGGAGGGAVQLNVAGASTVNGTISAIGTTLNYGSSGGSVFLTTGALNGNGTLRAHGGPSVGTYCSGGGGRIAVILTNSMNFDNVKMQAYTSAGAAAWPGAGGTVYLQHTNHPANQGKLIVDYNDIIPVSALNAQNAQVVCVTLQNGLDASAYAFSEIVLTNGGVYALDANDTLTITNLAAIKADPTDRNDGIYLAGGTLNVPASFNAYSNFFLGIGTTGSQIIPTPASLTVGTNANLKLDAPFTLTYPLTVAPGGVMDHSANATAEAYKLDLTVNGNLEIQSGGQVNVNGLGYTYESYSSHGPGKVVSGSAGGGYGGAGGKRYLADVGGTTYGSITAPTNIGSAGAYNGARGGGAIKLNVTGATTVNGVISANALTVTYSGSGGSVFLTTGTLTGNGTIMAGGNSAAWQFGGGGRVAVILTNENDFGAVTINAWPGNHVGDPVIARGGAGTVYLQTMAQGPGRGTLILDATNRVQVNATLINSNVTGTLVGTVVITNGAVLVINTNQSLTVNGSWLNRSTPINGNYTNFLVSFTACSNSTVTLASTNTAIVAGTNTFHNLICNTLGKTVQFTAGTTNVVNGQLTLGSEMMPGQGGVTLQSTADGSYWYLTLAAGGSQQMGALTVKDSYAGGGQTLNAGNGSIDLGHNVNWAFPASGTTIIMR